MSNKIQARWYQTEASQALYDSVKSDPQCNPVVVVPTGGGKTIILCQVIDLILSDDPSENVLVLSHDKRILRQNHEALENYFEMDVGLYCSGMGSKTIKKITVASIQSIYKKPEMFDRFGKILVDECHLVTIDQAGMYRKFLAALNGHQVAGLTATDFRTGYGYIHKGEDALFNHVAYDLSSTENFNRLVDEGYLSELFAKPTAMKLQTDDLKKLGGDFSQKDMSKKLDRADITESAVIESINYGKNYKRWLCFAIDIAHAEHIKERFLAHGIPAACVHSKSDEDDEMIINQFRTGKFRVLIGIGMLTTGLDIPDIDMIILMRPTQSPVLHIQMIGRGLRVVYGENMPLETTEERLAAIQAGPKKHCLVLDFSGNVARLGPINHITIHQKDPSKGGGNAITKECPVCSMITYGAAKFCDNCGHEFVFIERLHSHATDEEIVAAKKKFRIEDNVKTWADVDSVSYSRHISHRGTPDQMVVNYKCGLSIVREYVSLDHNGKAKYMARHWVDYRWPKENGEAPANVTELLKNAHLLIRPNKIFVDTRGEYPAITDAVFDSDVPMVETTSRLDEPRKNPYSEEFEDDIPF